MSENSDVGEELESELAEKEVERWSDENFGMHVPVPEQDMVEFVKEMHDDEDE